MQEAEEAEGNSPGGERKYGKRIDHIRKKLREVLAYSSSRATETSSSIERTFLPAHLKTEIISPTPTTEILLSVSTTYPSPQIFRPEFRKNILGRLNRQRFPQPQSEESSEEILPESPSEEEEEEYLPDTDSAAEDYYEEAEDYIEIVSSIATSQSAATPLYVSTSSSVIVPKPIIAPIASTKTISGQLIPTTRSRSKHISISPLFWQEYLVSIAMRRRTDTTSLSTWTQSWRAESLRMLM